MRTFLAPTRALGMLPIFRFLPFRSPGSLRSVEGFCLSWYSGILLSGHVLVLEVELVWPEPGQLVGTGEQQQDATLVQILGMREEFEREHEVEEDIEVAESIEVVADIEVAEDIGEGIEVVEGIEVEDDDDPDEVEDKV